MDPESVTGDFTYVILVACIPSSTFFRDHNIDISRHEDELGWRNIGFIKFDDYLICVYEYDAAPSNPHTAFAINPNCKDPSDIVEKLIELTKLSPNEILGGE